MKTIKSKRILLRGLRGSAPAGLAGIAGRGRGGLVRPAITVHARRPAGPRHGARPAGLRRSANRDPRHLRSWVPDDAPPLLNERLGPRLRSDVLAQGRHAASDRRAWDRILDLVADLGLRVRARALPLPARVCAAYDNALSVALFARGGPQSRTRPRPHASAADCGTGAAPSGRRLALGDGWSAEVAFDQVRVSRDANPAVDCALERIWPTGERGTARFGGFEIAWSPASAPAQIERATWTTWLDSAAWEVRRPRAAMRWCRWAVWGIGGQALTNGSAGAAQRAAALSVVSRGGDHSLGARHLSQCGGRAGARNSSK